MNGEQESIRNKNELMYFKDDILKALRQMESKVNQKFDLSLFEIKKQIKSTENKYEALNESVNYLSKEKVTDNNINSKLEQLFQFKSTTESSLASLSFRNDQFAKDLKDAVYKYDKIIIDNLVNPGIIGNNCKFKTLRDFIEYVNKHISELLLFKDKNSLDLNGYKVKLESSAKSLSTRIDTLMSTMMQFTTKNVKELEDKITNDFKSLEERIQEMRIENSKYTVQLKYQSSNLTNEWDKVVQMKEEIIKYFEYSNIKVDESIKSMEHCLLEYNKQYKQIKNKFIIVSNILKDIKLGKDGLMRKDIEQISNILNKEEDVNINLHSKVNHNKNGLNAESFIKKYIKGEVDVNSMSLSKKSDSNKGLLNGLGSNKSMTNLLILKNITKEHKNLTNTEEHVSQKDNKNVTDDGYDSEITKQQIRKTKTKGFNSDNVISNNSEKLKNENGDVLLLKAPSNKENQQVKLGSENKMTFVEKNDDNIIKIKNQNHLLNDNNNIKQIITLLPQKGKQLSEENFTNEIKSTENNNKIISVANKNKCTTNETLSLSNPNKNKNSPSKNTKNDIDKTTVKSKTRNDSANVIEYKTQQQFPISNLNFPQISDKSKRISNNKILFKNSSEPLLRIVNCSSKKIGTSDIKEYVHEVKEQLPKESMDSFYLKTSDRLYHQPTKQPINKRNKRNSESSLNIHIKSALSNSMIQTQKGNTKEMNNNYYYNLMVNEDYNKSNSANSSKQLSKKKRNSHHNHKTVFLKLVNNQPKTISSYNTKDIEKDNQLFQDHVISS